MATQTLTSTDGFIHFDLGEGVRHVGAVRLARKVLLSSATDLARSLTYRFASFEHQLGGSSIGLNAEPDGRSGALAAFAEEIAPLLGGGLLRVDPGTGVGSADLAAATAVDDRWSGRNEIVDGLRVEDAATAAGIVAATKVALGGLDGASICLAGLDPVSVAAALRAQAQGARIVGVASSSGASLHPDGLEPDRLREAAAKGAQAVELLTDSPAPVVAALEATCDALLVAMKPGFIDHENVDGVTARVIVPTGPVPATARAYAVAGRRGIAVLPDFVVTGGGLVTWTDPGSAGTEDLAADSVGAVIADILGHEEGPILAACYRAEAYLRTWCDALPFGRPFAA